MAIKTKFFFSYENVLLSFFVFAAVFPSIRVFLIGYETSSTINQFILSGLNDFFIFLLLIFGFWSVKKESNSKFQIQHFDKAVGAYFLFNIIYGIFMSGDLKLSIYGFRLTYEPMLCYFAARILFFRNSSQDKLLHSIFILLTIISATGLVLYFIFPDFTEYMMRKGHYFQSVYFIPRMGSIFWNPIFFASLAAISALYFYYRIQLTFRFYELIYFVIHFSCLILTVSRGALIAFTLCYILISIYLKNFRITFLTIILMLVNIFVLMFALTGSTNVVQWMIYSTGNTIELNGNVNRVELWRRSWIDFVNRPFGYGLGKAGHVAHRFLMDSNVPASRWSTDGWYLKLANETGILGVLSFCLFVYVYLKGIVAKSDILSNKEFVFFFSLGLFVLVQNIVSNVLDFYYFSFLFWFLIGISVNKSYRKMHV